ncbi:L,D-transpeptidase Cds6 family protein [Desulfovibrio inopinatus]|uniref:L,D-transpeptidase Cds6 family protein n=1 Tax=Desulfovibrio inopinatus TaxID=102109 RepID=UPI000423DAF7|nr:L,D-transpeptidase family protein [Desulfovibrio inopinatus]
MAFVNERRVYTPAIACVVVVFLFLACPGFARAGWHMNLQAEPHGPSQFLVVDKSAQTFYLFEQKSPLKNLAKIPCATGQVMGDKYREGDLKTPEGVYFVKSRLNGGLDYDLYGDLAFPLNFPNPIDIIKGKSGHGIWIHGRGHDVTPRETKGCIALNTPDIRDLDASIHFRMPVFIGERVTWSKGPSKINPEAKDVIEKTRQWAQAWQNQSEDFFELHDKKKFAIAQGESFARFENHKRKLFSRLPWIKVHIDHVAALPGPDYWVTTFRQIYRSPTFTSAGIKRLYWQKDDIGEFKIVGMEFEQLPLDRTVLASLEDNLASDASSRQLGTPSSSVKAQQSEARLVAENTTKPQAKKHVESGVQSTAPKPTPLVVAQNTVSSAPETPAASQLAETQRLPSTVTVDHNTTKPKPKPQHAKSDHPESKAKPVEQHDKKTTQLASNEKTTPPVKPVPKQSKPAKKKLDIVAVVDIVNGWSKAWQSADINTYLSYYSDDARQGRRRGKNAIKRQKTRLWESKPPTLVDVTELRVTETDSGCVASFVQEYAGVGVSARKGRKELFFKPINGSWRIVRETFERM